MNKYNSSKFLLLGITFITLLFSACKKEEPEDPNNGLKERTIPEWWLSPGDAVLMNDGKIFLLSTHNSYTETNKMRAAIYDPVADTWERITNPFPYRVGNPYLHCLQNGKILIMSGMSYGSGVSDYNLSYVTIFDPSNKTFTKVNDIPYPLNSGQVLEANDGKLYTSCGVYDPGSDTWSFEYYQKGVHVTRAWTPDGYMMSQKRVVSPNRIITELYDINTKEILMSVEALTPQLTSHKMVLSPEGNMWIGGPNSADYSNPKKIWQWNDADSTWQETSMSPLDKDVYLLKGENNKIYCYWNRVDYPEFQMAEYQATTQEWKRIKALEQSAWNLQMIVTPDNHLFWIGNNKNKERLQMFYIPIE